MVRFITCNLYRFFMGVGHGKFSNYFYISYSILSIQLIKQTLIQNVIYQYVISVRVFYFQILLHVTSHQCSSQIYIDCGVILIFGSNTSQRE